VNPFDRFRTEQVITNLKTGQYNVSGLILISSDSLVSNQTYHHPSLISLASIKEGKKLESYDLNHSPHVYVELRHTFVNRCKLIQPIIPVYQMASMVWLLIFGTFYAHTYYFNNANILPLQRVVVVIPFLKLFETVAEGIYVQACPWLDSID
jgi:hypothetical protein